MGKTFDQLNDGLLDFIAKQKLFFVATAPLSIDGHVNLSPKGYDSLVVLDSLTVAYIDLGGSGIETQAHLRENSRITLMFCALEGPAKILRLYGQGEAITFDDPRFDDLMGHFPSFSRARAVVKIQIERIADSCGWGVPFFAFQGERDQLARSVVARPFEDWTAHRFATNSVSVDGLPGLTPQNKETSS